MTTAPTPDMPLPDSSTTPHEPAVTVIPPTMCVRGEIVGDTALLVVGRVFGRIELEHDLVVAASGVVEADVVVRGAVVHGVVRGSIRAHESVELTADAEMVGDIHAPRVILAEGTRFRGSLEMGASSVSLASSVSSAPPSPSSSARMLEAAAVTSHTASDSASDLAVRHTDVDARLHVPKRPSRPPMEPPAATGLAPKTLKTRVVVKRRPS